MNRDSQRIANTIAARLSLRKPQQTSLEILADLLDQIELDKAPDLPRTLQIIQSLYPGVSDFERDFPSLCFALATGVGKTRLMGAFISYLYLTGRSRNFFVLAPNLTIYEKLIQDFSRASPKYVFQGISEFAQREPLLITGENYAQGGAARERDLFGDDGTCHINLFNISKINFSDTEGKGKKLRIRSLQETIGQSYFDYLASLPDLVILMDEAHRYRADAGARAINELHPILGLELTATPKTTGAKPRDFKNVVFHYPLSQALADGYVKEPAVATRQDFKPGNHNDAELEAIKLEDGIHCHERVKVELETHARQQGGTPVKPFMLVVAQDTTHASQLRQFIQSDDFFEGRYAHKVIEVHSNQRGEESDEAMQRLLAVETDRDTEIVIHVNKLKEGWDVTNLYTIVPLRASASEILTEQTIGRGLRLPYGKRTGVQAVDQLTIIAHDRFQEIVDRANDPESILKKTVVIGEDGDIPLEKPRVVEAPSVVETLLTGEGEGVADSCAGGNTAPYRIHDPESQRVAKTTLDVLRRYEDQPSIQTLKDPEIQKKIIQEVTERITPVQGELAGVPPAVDVARIVATVTGAVVEYTIEIPNIVLIPTREVSFGYRDFDLAGLERINFQPIQEDIRVRGLHTGREYLIQPNDAQQREPRPENYVVAMLVERDEIDYDEHADLLYKLTGQIAARLHSYLRDEADIHRVMAYYRRSLADLVFSQMQQHTWETPTDYQVKVSRGFGILKPANFSASGNAPPRHFREPLKAAHQIRHLVFSGFQKCCYPLQKFDSMDGEWRLAQVLEDDPTVLRWMKPAPGQFRIEYRGGHAYEPDFVVETQTEKLLIEPKRESEMDDEVVRLKSRAAGRWCQHASDHARAHGGKPWHYLLVPHTAIGLQTSVAGLHAQYASGAD